MVFDFPNKNESSGFPISFLSLSMEFVMFPVFHYVSLHTNSFIHSTIMIYWNTRYGPDILPGTGKTMMHKPNKILL